MAQQGMRFEKEVRKFIRLKYLFYLPGNYNDENGKKWPLVLFLHGAGEIGDDLEVVKRNGIPKIVESDDSFPFIAVSPQCPDDTGWENHFDEIDLLLNELQYNYNIDEDRIYVTGISMGGYGTWDIAMAYPERFAAIIPICGGTVYPELVGLLRNIPIWAFHGARDTIVPVQETRVLIEALKGHNPFIKYTEYPEAGHDSWSDTYNNKELYSWMLNQVRKSSIY